MFAAFYPLEPRRLFSAVAVDPTFADTGDLTISTIGTDQVSLDDSALDASQKLVVVGHRNLVAGFQQTFITRLTTGGRSDPSFGGKKAAPEGSTFLSPRGHITRTQVQIQPDRKILVGESYYDQDYSRQHFVLTRLNSDGTLDKTFGKLGQVTINPVFGEYHLPFNITVLIDGKIFIDGPSDVGWQFHRLNADGTPDTTFPPQGFGQLDLGPLKVSDVLARPDDSVFVLTGSQYPFLSIIRIGRDGAIDRSFGDNGRARTRLDSERHLSPHLVAAPDGDLLIASAVGYDSTTRFSLARFDPEGHVRTSFARHGIASFTRHVNPYANFPFTSTVQVQSKKILFAVDNGSGQTFVTRLFNNGQVDRAFGNKGTTRVPLVYSVNFQVNSAGQILFPDWRYDSLEVIRRNSDGRPDDSNTSFAQIAFSSAANDSVVDAAVTADQKILILTSSNSTSYRQSHFFLSRYSQDGRLDTSFASNGQLEIRRGSAPIVLQSDGKILLRRGSVITRLTIDGQRDTTFASNGRFEIPGYWIPLSDNSFASLVFGPGIAAPPFPDKILSFTADGTPRASLSIAGSVHDALIAPAPGGKIIYASEPRLGDSVVRLQRLNSDLTLDNSYADHGTLDIPVPEQTTFFGMRHLSNLIAAPDGSTILEITNNDQNQQMLGRITAAGALDTHFGQNGFLQLGDAQNSPTPITFQDDGKIIFASSVDGDITIQRLTTTGQLDSTFNNSAPITLDDRPRELLLQNNTLLVFADSSFSSTGFDAVVTRLLLDS